MRVNRKRSHEYEWNQLHSIKSNDTSCAESFLSYNLHHLAVVIEFIDTPTNIDMYLSSEKKRIGGICY